MVIENDKDYKGERVAFQQTSLKAYQTNANELSMDDKILNENFLVHSELETYVRVQL